MEKVKPGKTLMIDGTEYRIGEGSATAINVCVKLLEDRHMEPGKVDAGGVTIDLYTADGQGGESFPPSKILEALKRAEKADWNKTPQGL